VPIMDAQPLTDFRGFFSSNAYALIPPICISSSPARSRSSGLASSRAFFLRLVFCYRLFFLYPCFFFFFSPAVCNHSFFLCQRRLIYIPDSLSAAFSSCFHDRSHLMALFFFFGRRFFLLSLARNPVTACSSVVCSKPCSPSSVFFLSS